MTDRPSVPQALTTPGITRRLACFVYEGVLLFGVLMGAGLVYSIATNQRHALVGALGMQIFLFAVLAVYFVWFWSRQGQTLAMRTWHMRLVTVAGQAVSPVRALCRYLLAWMWFLPALAGLHLNHLTTAAPAFATIGAGVLAYAGLAWLHPDRQFLHDAVCGTRLVTAQTPARPTAAHPA